LWLKPNQILSEQNGDFGRRFCWYYLFVSLRDPGRFACNPLVICCFGILVAFVTTKPLYAFAVLNPQKIRCLWPAKMLVYGSFLDARRDPYRDVRAV